MLLCTLESLTKTSSARGSVRRKALDDAFDRIWKRRVVKRDDIFR